MNPVQKKQLQILALIGAPIFLSLTASSLHAQETEWLPMAPSVEEAANLNSPQRETNICLTANGLEIYFTTLRGGALYNQILTTYQGIPVFDGDIWRATRPDVQSPFEPPSRLPAPVNNQHAQDEVHISPDGKLLTFQSWSDEWASEQGPYYEVAVSGNGSWQTPHPLGGTITRFFLDNSFLATDGMTRTRDGSIIFAAGSEYDEPMDLYYARKLPDGRFGPVIALGCNTPHDERSVFLSEDDQTLFFASNRPGGAGGLDIFRVTLRSDWTVSEARNIGAPYNTSEDEYGVTIHTQDEAFFIRNGDIFRATQVNAAIIPEVPFVKEPVLQPLPELVEPVVRIETAPLTFSKTNNIVFILDRSNSMDRPDRLPLLVACIKRLAPFFRKEDRISVVAFSDKAQVLLNATEGNNQQSLLNRLAALEAGGGTKGEEALELGVNLAINSKYSEGNNVLILATDGQIDDINKLYPIAKPFKKEKLRLIVLSYGNPEPEVYGKLDKLSQFGEGWHASINASNIDEVMERALLATRQGSSH